MSVRVWSGLWGADAERPEPGRQPGRGTRIGNTGNLRLIRVEKRGVAIARPVWPALGSRAPVLVAGRQALAAPALTAARRRRIEPSQSPCAALTASSLVAKPGGNRQSAQQSSVSFAAAKRHPQSVQAAGAAESESTRARPLLAALAPRQIKNHCSLSVPTVPNSDSDSDSDAEFAVQKVPKRTLLQPVARPPLALPKPSRPPGLSGSLFYSSLSERAARSDSDSDSDSDCSSRTSCSELFAAPAGSAALRVPRNAAPTLAGLHAVASSRQQSNLHTKIRSTVVEDTDSSGEDEGEDDIVARTGVLPTLIGPLAPSKNFAGCPATGVDRAALLPAYLAYGLDLFKMTNFLHDNRQINLAEKSFKHFLDAYCKVAWAPARIKDRSFEVEPTDRTKLLDPLGQLHNYTGTSSGAEAPAIVHADYEAQVRRQDEILSTTLRLQLPLADTNRALQWRAPEQTSNETTIKVRYFDHHGSKATVCTVAVKALSTTVGDLRRLVFEQLLNNFSNDLFPEAGKQVDGGDHLEKTLGTFKLFVSPHTVKIADLIDGDGPTPRVKSAEQLTEMLLEKFVNRHSARQITMDDLVCDDRILVSTIPGFATGHFEMKAHDVDLYSVSAEESRKQLREDEFYDRQAIIGATMQALLDKAQQVLKPYFHFFGPYTTRVGEINLRYGSTPVLRRDESKLIELWKGLVDAAVGKTSDSAAEAPQPEIDGFEDTKLQFSYALLPPQPANIEIVHR